MAICKVFRNYCKENGIQLHDKNFTLSYDTNIPRQTGLSGSSAIVSAALSCLLDFYNVRQSIRIEVRPNLILNAEKELGIVAGLQDRVAQVYGGGLVHMVRMIFATLFDMEIFIFHRFCSVLIFFTFAGF
jgi:glucuronokinase